MPQFTAFDPATRIILYSGTATIPSALPHAAFEGLAVDSRTYRVTADLSGVELKPALGATVDPLTIAAGASVTITVPEVCSVSVDGVLVGEVGFVDTLAFPSPGIYTVTLEPVSQLLLPQSETVTVT